RWHPHFYSSSRLTLNLTRREMVAAGFSPSVRLFEAAACGTPILSDTWPGLETFFRIGEEILVAKDSAEIVSVLKHTDDAELRRIGDGARERALAEHSSSIRAEQFENHVAHARSRAAPHQVLSRSASVPRSALSGQEYQPFS